MGPWVRETLVTLATAIVVAGPIAAAALVALPESWRRPRVLWAVLIVTLALVAGRRRARRPPP